MSKNVRARSLIAFILAVLMLAPVLAGCGGEKEGGATSPETQQTSSADDGAAQPKEPVTLEFWTIYLRPTFDDYFNDLFARYKEENSHVTINWTDLPYDSIQNKLITAAAGGNAPDVVNLNTQMAMVMAGKDILVNLDEAATAEQKSEYIETLLNSARTSKGVFAFPWYGAPAVMIYNKDLFSKAGITTPPKTFDEMLAMGSAMMEKTGAYLFIPDQFSKILWLEGVPLISEDKTKAAFNTDETLEILNKYKKAADDRIIPKTDWGDWNKMLQQFSTGKLAMMNSGAHSITRVKDEAPNIYETIDVAPSMVGKSGIVSNSIMNVVVPTLSRNVEEAVDFAYFVTNDENQLAFAKTVAIFPSTVKAAADPFFTEDTSTLEKRAVAIAAEELQQAADMSFGVTKEAEIFTAINNAQQAVLLGNTDPKKALDEAEQKVNEILESIAEE